MCKHENVKKPTLTALNVQRLFAELTPKALERLEALLDSPNNTVKLAAIQTALAYAWGRPKTTAEISVTHDETDKLAQRKTLRKMIRARPELADVAADMLLPSVTHRNALEAGPVVVLEDVAPSEH